MSPEKKVVAGLIALVIILEVSTRIAEPYLSKDLAHIRTFPQIAEQFGSQEEGSVHSLATRSKQILVLGNSLARCGIAHGALRDGLSSEEGEEPSNLAYMTPDGTSIVEWAWGYRRYLLHQDARPDLVILLTGPLHLQDPRMTGKRAQRLGAFFVASEDREAFASHWINSTEQRLQFTLAGYSRLAADRARLRPLMFYRLVPGYETTANEVNIALGGGRQAGDGKQKSGVAVKGGLSSLELLIESVSQSGAQLVVATVPQPKPYDLPDLVSEKLRQLDIPVVDLGKTMLLPEQRFPDGYHLDDQGAAAMTSELVDGINAVAMPKSTLESGQR